MEEEIIMDNIKINEIKVLTTKEFINAIKNIFEYKIDVKIYISDLLFERLRKENKKNIIWEENFLDSENKAEIAFMFYIEENNEKIVYQIHLKSIYLKYFQLTFFASNGIKYKDNSGKNDLILKINTD